MKYRFDILRRKYQFARRPAWLSLDLHGAASWKFPGIKLLGHLRTESAVS